MAIFFEIFNQIFSVYHRFLELAILNQFFIIYNITVFGGRIFLQENKNSKVLSTEDQILKAEIIRCIDKIADLNMFFSSAESDNEKYARMFFHSTIAKGYQQKRSKVKYMIQFGIYLERHL